MTNTIKVAKMPGELKSFIIEEGATVSSVLALAGITSEGHEIKVDGQVYTEDQTLPSTANLVLLTKKVKGNAGEVKIAKMPGELKSFFVEDGTTVAQLLELAGLDDTGHEIKVDGQVKTKTDVLPSTANLVLLTKKVKGN